MNFFLVNEHLRAARQDSAHGLPLRIRSQPIAGFLGIAAPEETDDGLQNGRRRGAVGGDERHVAAPHDLKTDQKADRQTRGAAFTPNQDQHRRGCRRHPGQERL